MKCFFRFFKMIFETIWSKYFFKIDLTLFKTNFDSHWLFECEYFNHLIKKFRWLFFFLYSQWFWFFISIFRLFLWATFLCFYFCWQISTTTREKHRIFQTTKIKVQIYKSFCRLIWQWCRNHSIYNSIFSKIE